MNSAHNTPQSSKDLTSQRPQVHTGVRREEQLRIVFEKKYEFYVGLAYSILRAVEDAEDIVSDVFHRALFDWGNERFGSIQNLEAYLNICVQNACKNLLKKQKRERVYIESSIVHATSICNPMAKFDLDIQYLLSLLPSRQGEAFGLLLQGYSHEEIAVRMQCSEGASRNLLYNAKKKLRKLLGIQPDHDPDDDNSPGANNRRPSKPGKGNTPADKYAAGDMPKLLDLLNYLSKSVIAESSRKKVIQWLIEEDNAIEVMLGYKIALQYNSAKEIEKRIEKNKSKLWVQLFGKGARRFTADTPMMKPCRNVPVGFEYSNDFSSNGNISGKIECFYLNNKPIAIIDPHRKNNISKENTIENYSRLIAPTQKTKPLTMETRKFIFDKFQDYVQEGYHDYCNRHGLSKTEDQFITFLIDQNLISRAQLQRYTIQREFEQLCDQYKLPKTRAVDTLSDRFMLSDRTIWNLLREKKDKKK